VEGLLPEHERGQDARGTGPDFIEGLIRERSLDGLCGSRECDGPEP
jgi:hypothetical protein